MNNIQDIILNPKFKEYENITNFCIIVNLIKIYNYEVIIYGGGGSAGVIALTYLKRENIIPSYIIDLDESKSGTKLDGIEIISPSQIKNKIHKPNNTYTIIVTSFFETWQKSKITELLHTNNLNKYFYLNNIEGVKTEWLQYYTKNLENIIEFYNSLDDVESKEALTEYIRCVVQNDAYKLNENMTKYKYFGCNTLGEDAIYTHIPNENWINCGSASGDTIYRFVAKGYKFQNIFAFEGEPYAYQILKSNISLLPKEITEKILLFNEFLGLDSSTFNFNSHLKDSKISLINMDIEGAELSVLKDIKELIIKNEPVLAICLYHKKEDIVEIPKFIRNCSKNYHFFIRKYSRSYTTIPHIKDELVLYAVPTNRLA